MTSSAGPPSGLRAKIRAVFEAAELSEPYTAVELADEIDRAVDAVAHELAALFAEGVLGTKRIETGEQVWWLRTLAPESTTTDGSVPPRTVNEVVRSERQFRAVFDEAFDAILIADDDARYVDANPAACELFGLSRAQLLGRTISEFAAEGYDFEDAWNEFQASALETGVFPLVRSNGTVRTVEFSATPNILPGRHLSVLRDITERRKAMTALKAEQARSERYQRTLTADSVIEIEFELADGNAFGELSRELECRCDFEGMVSISGGDFLNYVTVTCAVPEDIEEFVMGFDDVNRCRVVSESDTETLLELIVDHSPIQTVVEAGASGKSLRSENGLTTVVAEIGADADLNGLIDAFLAEYPTAAVVAKRTFDRPIVTTLQSRDSLRDELTPRQTETLRAAYLAGYFEWPRESNAEDIAQSMNIATSTWLRHLRLAESKLTRWFFGG